MSIAELQMTEDAGTAFKAVVDFFHAATAPGATCSFSLSLGEGGGGLSFGSVFGGAAPAAEGGAAPAADGGGAGAAAPAPSVE